MSYYKTKAIRLKRNGKISVTVASSNVWPVTYWTTDYDGTLADLLVSIFEGNFHLQNTKGLYKFHRVMEAINKIARETLEKNGINWEIERRYELSDYSEGIRIICNSFAEVMLKDEWNYSKEFSSELGEKLTELILRAKKNLREAKEKDAANGIMRIQCAAMSIFHNNEGDEYDLLEPYNGNWVLAPAKDYHCGKLQTSEEVYDLGSDAWDLYPFLSFSGRGESMDEIISKCPIKAEAIKDRFARVDKSIEGIIQKGLRIKPGVAPYVGYAGVA